MNKTALILIALLMAGAANAQAGILFDNGVGQTPIAGGAFADTTYDFGGTIASEAGNVFTPTASGTAHSVVFDGFYFNGGNAPVAAPADIFTLSLYSTSAGAPSGSPTTTALSEVSMVNIGSYSGEGGEYPIYQYTASIDTPFSLSTETTYYLGFSDTDTPADQFTLVRNETGPATALYQIVSNNGSTPSFQTQPSAFPAAFEVSSNTAVAAPEPSSVALMLIGVLAFEIRRRAVCKRV